MNIETLTAKGSGCDDVIHSAAIETQNSFQVLLSNVLGTWNVLYANINAHLREFVYTRSVDALEKISTHPFSDVNKSLWKNCVPVIAQKSKK